MFIIDATFDSSDMSDTDSEPETNSRDSPGAAPADTVDAAAAPAAEQVAFISSFF
jgi:hypothetical protein